ncbi:MAG TPA: hypothetical protein VK838_04020 [Candidatus Limnocylindrales bacterium]|nr:hypothetical protein [Candidatus Limnocylindrales bacterium]
MSIRLDPRRLSALKLLAAEAGVRPGELVTSWVEERLDAARGGGRPAPTSAPAPGGISPSAFADLAARVDQLARRLDSLTTATEPAAAQPASTTQPAAETADAAPAEAATAQPRRRGRPPKKPAEAAKRASGGEPRVPLHEEIAEVIREHGPMTASAIASAIVERGRYAAPRSSRPLDGATVNSRVSNPAYRSRFARSDGRIGLA